jgi:hypothetical protein
MAERIRGGRGLFLGIRDFREVGGAQAFAWL